MYSWGKIIGGFFGFLLAGPIGALFGVVIGHNFDKGLRINWQGMYMGYGGEEHRRIQEAFFKSTFSIMGHVAKADGRISEDEIRMARSIMDSMRLTEAQKQEAIGYYNAGKQSDFNFQQALDELIRACHRQRILLQMFVEIQFQAASAEGGINPSQQQILDTLCQRLGVRPTFYRYEQTYRGKERQYKAYQPRSTTPLQEAYTTLSVSPSASQAEIKRAYRKLMSQHHPDKLVAKGLPEEMIKLATEKTQRIQAAYESIKEAKGF